MTREALKSKLEFMREMNDKREKPLKTASELARAGCSCGNCTYFEPPELSEKAVWLASYCDLKKKNVKSYNICTEWKNEQ